MSEEKRNVKNVGAGGKSGMSVKQIRYLWAIGYLKSSPHYRGPKTAQKAISQGRRQDRAVDGENKRRTQSALRREARLAGKVGNKHQQRIDRQVSGNATQKAAQDEIKKRQAKGAPLPSKPVELSTALLTRVGKEGGAKLSSTQLKSTISEIERIEKSTTGMEQGAAYLLSESLKSLSKGKLSEAMESWKGASGYTSRDDVKSALAGPVTDVGRHLIQAVTSQPGYKASDIEKRLVAEVGQAGVPKPALARLEKVAGSPKEYRSDYLDDERSYLKTKADEDSIANNLVKAIDAGYKGDLKKAVDYWEKAKSVHDEFGSNREETIEDLSKHFLYLIRKAKKK